MKEPIKVSVLIPAYNVERYIDQCLDSAMGQTLREIEIIVVDDGSTDTTLAHIQAAAEKDNRIRVIRHKENRKTLQARKDAVLASRGEYVMFLDADDYLSPNACETVYENAVRSGADILQFGIIFENCGDLPDEYLRGREQGSNLYQTVALLGQPLVQNYTREYLSSMVAQKAVRGETAKRAYRKTTDLPLAAAEDEYATCLLLMESSRLAAIPDKLYHYCYGRGVFGRRVVKTEGISFHCDGATAYHELEKYVSSLPPAYGDTFIAAAKEAAEKLKKNVLQNQLAAWLSHIKPADQPGAYLVMEQAWKLGGPGFVGLLAQHAWADRAAIAGALSGADWLPFQRRPIKTIAFYYFRYRGGGVERVVTQVASLLAELRHENGDPMYRVVLISDEAPHRDDYPLSPLVIREQLPPYQDCTAEKYASRAEKWQALIVRHGIDAVFYSYWLNPYLLWDLLSVKRSQGHPAFVVHTHCPSAQLYGLNWLYVQELQRVYGLADAVITLSETDRQYWSRCHSASLYIPNPCFVKASACHRAAYGKHILWLGRIDKQKNPMEILSIMRQVHTRDPEIICHVVGAYDAALEAQLRQAIAAEGLTHHVRMEGFHVDVTPYYERCSLFLMTSRFEGFPLTLFEAASHGLPTVLYEMPWLAYNHLIEGAIALPQLDAEAAAEAIVDLVNNPVEWQRRSDAIYESALRYEKTDIAAYWTSLMDGLEKGSLPASPRFDEKTDALLDLIDWFRDDALHDLLRERDGERNQLRLLDAERLSWDAERRALDAERSFWRNELFATQKTVSFRVGRLLTWLPRKLRGGIRCYREHGAKYTLGRLLYHLRLTPHNHGAGPM